MSSKNKRKDSGNLKQEEILTAVVIASSFDKRFFPISASTPKILIPLANKPLISYTLDNLVLNNVKRILVFCGRHGDQLKDYLDNSKWKDKRMCGAKVILKQSTDFHGVGDVLRHIDEYSLIHDDFILTFGDVVTNFNFTGVLEEHKARREQDKNVPLMTLVMNKLPQDHSTRMAENDHYMAADPDSKRILYFDRSTIDDNVMNIPMDVLKNIKTKLELFYDVVHTGIWMCSPAVPQIFQDNFDYQSQLDFIKGVIMNEEFLGHHIHYYLVENCYCIRVLNFRLYALVQNDIINRWVYPNVPEKTDDVLLTVFNSSFSNLSDKDNIPRYILHRRNNYHHTSTKLGLLTNVEKSSIIGPDCKIGDPSTITRTVMGSRCQFGDNCVLKGATFMKNVKVGNNCSISDSIICQNVSIGNDVSIEAGCILCQDVVISDGTHLKSGSIIHINQNDESDDDNKFYDEKLVGKNGVGHFWSGNYQEVSGDESTSEDEDFTDDNEVDEATKDLSSLSLDYNPEERINKIWGLKLADRPEKLVNENFGSILADYGVEAASSDANFDLEDEDEDVLSGCGFHHFQREVNESIERGLKENASWDNLFPEINGSKHANNIPMVYVIRALSIGLVTISKQTSDITETKFLDVYTKIVARTLPLLENYIKNEQSELETLEAYEKLALKHNYVNVALAKIFVLLYDHEVVSEDVILKWYYMKGLDEESKLIREKIKQLAEWLENAEEESD